MVLEYTHVVQKEREVVRFSLSTTGHQVAIVLIMISDKSSKIWLIAILKVKQGAEKLLIAGGSMIDVSGYHFPQTQCGTAKACLPYCSLYHSTSPHSKLTIWILQPQDN